MSVTGSDQEQEAAATAVETGDDDASVFQVARPRDDDDSAGSDNPPVTHRDAPWSMRAGGALRSGAGATFTHPSQWGIWDQHPATLRAIGRRARDSRGWNHDAAPVRWALQGCWLLTLAWSALFTLLSVAPRNKTCLAIAAVALIAWLTW